MSKKIFIYRWKAYNYEDIIKAFRTLDYEVDEIWQHLEKYDVDDKLADEIRRRLENDNYEAVFTVNYFPIISNLCQEMNIPYISWSCDNPMIAMYHKSVFNDCNRIFVFDKTNYFEFKSIGVKNIWYMPLACGLERSDVAISSSDDLEDYKNEISFVGSFYEKNSYDEIEPILTEYLRGYFECAMNLQADCYGMSFVENCLTSDIISQLEGLFEFEKNDEYFSDIALVFSTTKLGFKSAQLQRKRVMLELGKHFDVSCYTASDISDLIGVKKRGTLEYWSETPKVFNQSRINLNITIPNIKTGIPLRSWDIMGAGGFLMTNSQEEMPMFFNEREDYASYHTRDELCALCDYYLNHEDERATVAENGYKKVKANHTYTHRIEEILDICSEL